MTQRKDQKWLSAWLYSPRPTPLCRSHWFLDWLQLFVAAATPSSGLRLEGDLRGKFVNKISLFYPSMGRSRIKCVQLVIISYNTNVTLVPNAFFGNSQRRAPSTWFLSSRARKSNWAMDCKKEGSKTQQAKQMLTLRISLHKRSSVNTKEERTKRKGSAFSDVGTFPRIFQLCVFVSISLPGARCCWAGPGRKLCLKSEFEVWILSLKNTKKWSIRNHKKS